MNNLTQDIAFTGDPKMVSIAPRRLTMARVCLGWSRQQLARASGVTIETLTMTEVYGVVLDVGEAGALKSILLGQGLLFPVGDETGIFRVPIEPRTPGEIVFGGRLKPITGFDFRRGGVSRNG